MVAWRAVCLVQVRGWVAHELVARGCGWSFADGRATRARWLAEVAGKMGGGPRDSDNREEAGEKKERKEKERRRKKERKERKKKEKERIFFFYVDKSRTSYG